MQVFWVWEIFLLGLGIIGFVWQVSANGANESENKDVAGSSTTESSNSTEQEDQFNEEDYVTINSAGEVFPLHLNPALKPANETRIQKIKERRVVGGLESNPGAVPYQISIQINDINGCGGAIYNSKTIITAAHCFHSRAGRLSKEEIDAKIYIAGEFNVGAEEGNEQRRRAANIIFHPDYRHLKNFHDIAIVSVSEPFTYNQFVQPLPIDLTGIDNVEAAMISGWGYTVRRNIGENWVPWYYPRKLKEAIVRVFTREKCLKMWEKKRWMHDYAKAGLICAGKEIGSVDTCQGDSGGPLACFNPKEGNKRYLCGIASTGSGCGLPGQPGLYTRVSQYRDWIIKNAGHADRMTMDDSRVSVQLS